MNDRDEWRSAVYQLTDAERHTNCRHTHRTSACCPDCGDTTDNCWLWTGAVSGQYGSFRIEGKSVLAHRFSYELVVGPIPTGLHLDHRVTCPKLCVNPAHLRPVTRSQNMQNRSHAEGISGVRGVTWCKRKRKWKGQVGHVGVNYHAGYFTDLNEAAEAVRQLRLSLFTHSDMDLSCR